VIWLHPAALFALAAVAAPILIHILVQRRAERFAFPTLRFLRPTRLAAIRRHVLEDPLLLAVRSAILVLAVAASAGPLVVTRARRERWNQRVVRAIVVDSSVARAAGAREPEAYRAEEFRVPLLADGIRRAVDWLEQAPPARRELIVAGPLAIGSLSAADVAAIPSDVGVAFERTGSLPSARTVRYGSVRSAAGTIDREVTLDGPGTSVRDLPTTDRTSASPIEIVAPPDARPVVDAASAAVLSQRVWSPAAARRARLVVGSAAAADTARSVGSAVVTQPWMADAIARIARDADLREAAVRAAGAVADDRLPRAPWATIAVSADNRPLVAAAAADDRLVVVSGAAPADPITPILVRAVVNATAAVPDLAASEVVAIPDAQLGAWSSPAGTPPQPRIDAVDADDRRWLWLAVLALLVVEAWLRRSARRGAEIDAEETTRVA
jgi:aerotolerance regulator-like protein